jgi:dihydroorotate dehydrogenase
MGLSFRNDLGNAAGLDKDGSLLDFNYSLGAGFAVVGTVLSEPHTGNVFSFFGGLWKGNVWTPLPLSGAALNSLGLPSKGVDVALENIASFRSRNGVPPQSPDRRASGGAKGATSSSAAMPSAAAFPIGVSIMGHPAHATDPAKKQRWDSGETLDELNGNGGGRGGGGFGGIDPSDLFRAYAQQGGGGFGRGGGSRGF